MTPLEDRQIKGLAAVEALPATMRIGAFTFVIEKWTATRAAGNGRYGECSTVELRISIQRDMAGPEKAVDTFFHEVGHAIFWANGMSEEDKEERTVGAFGSAWVQLYRDNPWLLGWIAKALESA